MGNCQAIDAATLVIQHPCGKVDKLFWPVSACEVMKTNPGHYVALLISTTLCPDKKSDNKPVRVTRIKLLRPSDSLVLGQVYRLITAQDVMKGLGAKKQAKMKKALSETLEGVAARGSFVSSYIVDNKNNKKISPSYRCRSGEVTSNSCNKHEVAGLNPYLYDDTIFIFNTMMFQAIRREKHRQKSTAATPTNSAATARPRTWQPSLHSITEATS